MNALGATVATPRTEELGPMVAVRASNPERVVRGLTEKGIVTSSRYSNVRGSLHLYNNDDDLETFLKAFKGSDLSGWKNRRASLVTP
ncbi:MAG: hypothetical protein ACE5F5_12820 [Acidimicrobiia bacterium]